LAPEIVEGAVKDPHIRPGASELDSPILAERIEDHDVVAPAHRREAAFDVRLFIAGHDENGHGHEPTPETLAPP
jgi:hypothetical protein